MRREVSNPFLAVTEPFVCVPPGPLCAGRSGTNMLTIHPQDETDLRVVLKIIESAIWYTVEDRVDLESLLE